MIFALALALALQYTPATTSDSILEARTREVSAVLRCPVCQGLSIEASPSELSTEMKDVVREQLRAGKTPDEVKAYFVSKYGEWILLEPKASGVNLIVYALPIAVVLGGMIVILVMVRRWSAAGAGSSTVVAEEEDVLA